MMTRESFSSYEPNPALGWLYKRFFRNIEVDESWAHQVREAERQGTVVYVLRSLSFVDFLALDYLTKRLSLPRIRFANDLGLWVLEPDMGRGLAASVTPRTEAEDVARLLAALDAGASAALFLKRPPSVFDPSALGPSRGRREGDAFLKALVVAQRTSDRPILLVPQVFVWTRSADVRKPNALDAVFGPRQWPGKVRTVAQFLMNWRHVTLRAGEPVDLRAFVERQSGSTEGAEPPSDDVLVRRLTYTLLRRLERERLAVVGPTRKPSDRLREQVVRSPRLQKVIRDMAGHGETEQRVLGYRALAMLRELETEVNMNALKVLDATFSATVSRMYSQIDIDKPGLERLRKAAKDGSLVLLPSHKSHVDYIVLTWVFLHADMPVPLVAAGDNLAFFPLGPILRRAGAFFIRRSFRGDRLYGAVVDAYMRRLLLDGWPLEFFLEGTRSRTGKLLPPKLGLLSIVVDAALGATERGSDSPTRDVFFCPISIGYERLVEEREFVRELSGGEKRGEDVRGLVAAAESTLGRYGRLNIQFGELLTLEGVLAEVGEAKRPLSPARRRALVTRLAYRVMHEIGRVTAVTPSALVAAALLTHREPKLAHEALVESCERLATILHAQSARFASTLLVRDVGSDRPMLRHGAIAEACELLERAKHLHVERRPRPGPGAVYHVPERERLSLDISKNLIVHFFVSQAVLATPLMAAGDAGLDATELAERAQSLSRLLKYEFQLRADASFEAIFDETLKQMVADGEVESRSDGDARPRFRVASCGEGRERAVLYVRMVQGVLESYWIAARGAAILIKGPLTPMELTKRALTTGDRMVLDGEIRCREAVARPAIDNAHAAFVDLGYLKRAGDSLALHESYANPATVQIIEARVRSFLPRDL